MSAPDRVQLHDATVRLDSMPVTGRDVDVSPSAESAITSFSRGVSGGGATVMPLCRKLRVWANSA